MMTIKDNYFDDNSTVTKTTAIATTGASLTPTKLLLGSDTQPDLYMSEMNPFDNNNIFNTKFNIQIQPDYYQQETRFLPEDKKQRNRLLEKNREAAHRCRQKKKRYVHDLEEHSKILQVKNTELQKQLVKLKEESRYLRNLILTHSNCDCPGMQSYLRRTSEQLSSNLISPFNGVNSTTSAASNTDSYTIV